MNGYGILALVVLTVQNASIPILTRFARTRSGDAYCITLLVNVHLDFGSYPILIDTAIQHASKKFSNKNNKFNIFFFFLIFVRLEKR